ncbi:acyltransferase [Fibrella sp. HMF5335]|uniref:Acyltransferase n=1 Tax=Fibrella rubiginis TaxID=2817060 RepID=A0A939GLI3_9BACT|nr:acyltransferase [Fibrella rubiginis]MBO0939015.1 acyltransferase [Fibrella rubiginis]
MNQRVNRLKQLDFLRGIAILLVLLRHQELVEYTSRFGWIGVDLFFVLSGFLVSGLLFKEYIKFGNIKPSRFLIRRGFKIYPIYYLFYPVYLLIAPVEKDTSLSKLLPDLFFIQNYVYGWGYANESTWSLAIEEHFYIGFSLLLWLGLTKKVIVLNDNRLPFRFRSFETGVLIILAFCLCLRLVANLIASSNLDIARTFTMTHLRIDSLLMGVLISYFYTFRLTWLESLFARYKSYIFPIIIACLSFTPFIDPVFSYFVKTFGFSLLYIAFGLLLTYFLLDDTINKKLDLLFTKTGSSIISKIGFSSYSIYIIHVFINNIIDRFDIESNIVNFTLSLVISSITGIFMTTYIETFFLNIRDKYYPARSSV